MQVGLYQATENHIQLTDLSLGLHGYMSVNLYPAQVILTKMGLMLYFTFLLFCLFI